MALQGKQKDRAVPVCVKRVRGGGTEAKGEERSEEGEGEERAGRLKGV